MKDRILAHRGHWTTVSEKNSVLALERALAAGYGVETDIRDLNGGLVISHDPPRFEDGPMTVDEFLAMVVRLGATGWLALNIKADGLAGPLKAALDAHGIDRYFVFDMSVPDMRGYLAAGMQTYTRRSDIEEAPALPVESRGVWLDSFGISHSPSGWASEALAAGKQVALVSPELHGRPHEAAWAEWREALCPSSAPGVLVCTDYPDAALRFFEDGR